MSVGTSIEWTDASWNPIRARIDGKTGWHCEKVSPGCTNCYAEKRNHRIGTGAKYTKLLNGSPAYLDEKTLTEPLRRRKPRRVFVCSMTDVFGEWVADEWIDRIFAVMALAPQHSFQVLTKRSARMREWARSREYPNVAIEMHAILDNAERPSRTPEVRLPLPNVWLGVSAEDQQRLDERVPELLATPAAVRFVSAEPLLGPLRIPYLRHGLLSKEHYNVIDWVIVGGESGPRARPMAAAWARSIVEQCHEAGTKCFVKQLGAYIVDRNDAGFDGDEPESWPADTRLEDLTAQGWQGDPVRVRLRDRKGGDPAEWPEDLRVREWPDVERVSAGGAR